MGAIGMKATSILTDSLGRAIRNRRRTLGLSQEELAWRCGLNRSYITDIERGARNPSLTTIGRVAAGLKIPVYELLRDAAMAQDKKLPERNRDRAQRVKG